MYHIVIFLPSCCFCLFCCFALLVNMKSSPLALNSALACARRYQREGVVLIRQGKNKCPCLKKWLMRQTTSVHWCDFLAFCTYCTFLFLYICLPNRLAQILYQDIRKCRWWALLSWDHSHVGMFVGALVVKPKLCSSVEAAAFGEQNLSS